MLGLITQATGPNRLFTLHELSFGNDIYDLTGALACATSYHICHPLKLGNLPLTQRAIETGTLGLLRAFALSTAEALLNDYDIVSDGFILCCGFPGLMKDRGQLGSLTSSPCHAASTSLLQGTDSPHT